MRNMGLIVLILIAACRVADEHFISGDDIPAPSMATFRLIAPLSMTTVTQQKPMLRWVLGPDDGAPMVDLCKDRSCTMPLSITTQLAGDQLSAVPAAALPAGWVYWRVRVVVGSQTVSSATWQFWVGTSSASNPVDTSNGAILDVNGDGYPDLLVGSYGASMEGAAHLYLGSATASATGWNGSSPTGRIDLTNPDGASAQFGISVASAGDVNGDGYADFLVGASNAGSGAGAVHLYLGSAMPSAIAWNGASPTERIDLAITNDMSSSFGDSVASAGDVNGDGYADFLVGAKSSSEAAHLYLGSAMPSATAWNGASPTERIDLVNPDGVAASFGVSVASAGDVNGDGYADFLVGVSAAAGIYAANSRTGAAHLYFGSAMPSTTTWNGASATKRIDLASPELEGALFGRSVASTGDVNGDGYADFLVGASGGSTYYGAAHLYLGSAAPSATTWNGTATKRINLDDLDGPNSSYGGWVASAEDVNGDGYADFLVGAPGAPNGEGAGAVHLYLGSATPSATTWNGSSPKRIDLASPNGGEFGGSMTSAGDVNGDGFGDFLVGAKTGTYSGLEVAYLYLGAATPSAAAWSAVPPTGRIDLTSPDGASAHFGYSVANAENVNGYSYADLLGDSLLPARVWEWPICTLARRHHAQPPRVESRILSESTYPIPAPRKPPSAALRRAWLMGSTNYRADSVDMRRF